MNPGAVRSAPARLIFWAAVISVVLAVAVAVGPGVALAQDTDGNTTGNTTGAVTPTPGTPNATGNATQPQPRPTRPNPWASPGNISNGTGAAGSGGYGPGAGAGAAAGNSSGNGGGGILGTGFGFPGPMQLVNGVVSGIAASLSKMAIGMIDAFNNMFFRLPASGVPSDPSTWTNGDTGWWPAVLVLYGISSAIAIAMMIPPLMFAIDCQDEVERRERLHRIVKAFLMGPVLGFFICTGIAHLVGSIAVLIAPSGAEFLQTPGNMAKFGVGILGGALFAIWNTGGAVVAIAVMVGIWVLYHPLTGFWPLYWAFTVQPSDNVRNTGNIGIAAWILLTVLPLFQAMGLRFVFEIPWQATPSLGGAGSLILGVFTAGLGLVGFTAGASYIGLKKAIPTQVDAMGRRAARRSAGYGPASKMGQSVGAAYGAATSRMGGSGGSSSPDGESPTSPPPGGASAGSSSGSSASPAPAGDSSGSAAPSGGGPPVKRREIVQKLGSASNTGTSQRHVDRTTDEEK